MEIVNALKEAMRRTGVRNADVARACGITQQAVHQWFTKGTVSREHLMTAARMCGTTIDQLAGSPAALRPPPLDTEILRKAVGAVKQALDRGGKGKEFGPDELTEMIAMAYEKYILAQQAELAVEAKISQILQSSRNHGDMKKS